MTDMQDNEGREARLDIAMAAGHMAALIAYKLISPPEEDPAAAHEGANHWFAGGAVLDRDQDEDLSAIGRYVAVERRAAETTFRHAVGLGIHPGPAAGFDEISQAERTAYELFTETTRTTMLLLEKDAVKPAAPIEAHAPKLEDTIYERVGRTDERTLSDEDLARARREVREAKERLQKEAEEAAAAEQAERDAQAAAKAAKSVGKAKAAAAVATAEGAGEQADTNAAAPAADASSAKAKPNRSKGRTKAERDKAKETESS